MTDMVIHTLCGTLTVPQKTRYQRYASSFVTAEYSKYAAYGTRDSGILRIRKP